MTLAFDKGIRPVGVNRVLRLHAQTQQFIRLNHRLGVPAIRPRLPG
jgi:hypothetical protein